MKIRDSYLIIGSYGASNIGDEALLEVIIQELPQKSKKYILSGNPDYTRQQAFLDDKCFVSLHFPLGIRSFFSFAWLRSLSFLRKSDIVLLGPGGLFTDDYTLKAVILWSWQVFFCWTFSKDIILFANSVGPLRSFFSQKLSAWALGKCKKILARDKLSQDCVNKILPQKKVMRFTDIAFLYKLPISQKKRKKMIAINARDWRTSSQWVEKLIKISQGYSYDIVLIAMENDDSHVMRPYTQENILLVQPKNFSELCSILQSCEMAIGMRLHFLIAAILSHCKLAGISYSKKVEGILKETDIPFSPPETCDEAKLKELFCLAKGAKNIESLKKKAKESFDCIGT